MNQTFKIQPEDGEKKFAFRKEKVSRSETFNFNSLSNKSKARNVNTNENNVNAKEDNVNANTVNLHAYGNNVDAFSKCVNADANHNVDGSELLVLGPKLGRDIDAGAIMRRKTRFRSSANQECRTIVGLKDVTSTTAHVADATLKMTRSPFKAEKATKSFSAIYTRASGRSKNQG